MQNDDTDFYRSREQNIAEAHAEAIIIDAVVSRLLPHRIPPDTFAADSEHAASNGKLQHSAWPGLYPLYYLTACGDVLCPKCANDGFDINTVDALDIATDAPCYAQTNDEDCELFCSDCGERIPAACGCDDDDADAIESEQAHAIEEAHAHADAIAEDATRYLAASGMPLVITHISEYGSTHKLSTPINCF